MLDRFHPTMPSSHAPQLLEVLTRARRPVIVLPHGAGVDGYAAAFAFSLVLQALHVHVELVAADGPAPASLAFLGAMPPVRPTFGSLHTFRITLDVSRAELQELSYTVEGDRLAISLTPRSGLWTPDDVRAQAGEFRFDTIISLGAVSRESFGPLFEEQTEFWYGTPTVTLDCTPPREPFGHIPIMDFTATSVCEVLFDVLQSWDEALITEPVATCLLTGMIAATESFKTASVTPRTLERASLLISKGARRADIVDALFRTRSVATLRLWGRALARLKADAPSRLVWTVLTYDDFVHAGADESELPDVIDDLIHHAPEAETAVLLYENKERQVCGIISGGKRLDSLELALPFKPVGTRHQARICLPQARLATAEPDIVQPLIARATALRLR
jgi:phosphoesterase RecJ-like protein